MIARTRNTQDKLRRLQMSLQKKERAALTAKQKGMHSTFGNLMSEICELKRQVRKCQMGS